MITFVVINTVIEGKAQVFFYLLNIVISILYFVWLLNQSVKVSVGERN